MGYQLLVYICQHETFVHISYDKSDSSHTALIIYVGTLVYDIYMGYNSVSFCTRCIYPI